MTTVRKVLMDFWSDPDDDARRPRLSEEEVANNMCRAITSVAVVGGTRIPSVAGVRRGKTRAQRRLHHHHCRRPLILAGDNRQRGAGCHKSHKCISALSAYQSSKNESYRGPSTINIGVQMIYILCIIHATNTQMVRGVNHSKRISHYKTDCCNKYVLL